MSSDDAAQDPVASSEPVSTQEPPATEDALSQALRTTFGASGPACWGPVQWMALHQIARGYPRENPSEAKRQALVQYVTALADLLPCSFCGDHWRKLAPSIASATGSRYEALKWTIDAHNSVNARLKKPVLTYEQAVQSMQDRCPGNVFTGEFGPPGTAAAAVRKAVAKSDAEKQQLTGGLIGVSCLVLLLLAALLAVVIMKKSKKN